jgi:uncharacterized protein YbjQ (UPF0145 family)
MGSNCIWCFAVALVGLLVTFIIKRRKEKRRKWIMMIVTTEQVAGYDIKEVLGYVKGSTIQTKHIGRDITAGLKGIVGGEIKGYNEMMTEARKLAVHRMVKEAEEKGANAVIGMRMQTSTVMANAAEIIAYGTAVVIEKK